MQLILQCDELSMMNWNEKAEVRSKYLFQKLNLDNYGVFLKKKNISLHENQKKIQKIKMPPTARRWVHSYHVTSSAPRWIFSIIAFGATT